MAEYIYLTTGDVIEADVVAKTYRNPNLIQAVGARINQGDERYDLYIPITVIKFISNKKMEK